MLTNFLVRMLRCTETQIHFGNLVIQPSLNVSGVPFISDKITQSFYLHISIKISLEIYFK